MRPLQADAVRIWWLDAMALEQLVGGRGHAIDLLDPLGVPPYLSEEIRRLRRRLRGSIVIPPALGAVRLPKTAGGATMPDATRSCRGVVLRAGDVPALADLPGFVTHVDGTLVVPPPQERQGMFFRRIDAALRLGCACGRKIDLIANPPHLVEALRERNDDVIAIRCEGCASELVFVG